MGYNLEEFDLFNGSLQNLQLKVKRVRLTLYCIALYLITRRVTTEGPIVLGKNDIISLNDKGEVVRSREGKVYVLSRLYLIHLVTTNEVLRSVLS